MQYAKLVDGEPELAVMPLKVGGRDVWTSDPRPYGYKELILPPAPATPDGYVAEYDGWTETETQIIRKWAIVPLDRPTAEGNIMAGTYFQAVGRWYRALRVIVRGEQIVEGYNAQGVSLVDVVNQLNATNSQNDSEE